MPHPHYSQARSYQVSAAVAAGALVVADGSAATTVSTAGANAIVVLGVARNAAAPIPNRRPNTDSLAGVADRRHLRAPRLRRRDHGCDIPVTYAANAPSARCSRPPPPAP